MNFAALLSTNVLQFVALDVRTFAALRCVCVHFYNQSNQWTNRLHVTLRNRRSVSAVVKYRKVASMNIARTLLQTRDLIRLAPLSQCWNLTLCSRILHVRALVQHHLPSALSLSSSSITCLQLDHCSALANPGARACIADMSTLRCLSIGQYPFFPEIGALTNLTALRCGRSAILPLSSGGLAALTSLRIFEATNGRMSRSINWSQIQQLAVPSTVQAREWREILVETHALHRLRCFMLFWSSRRLAALQMCPMLRVLIIKTISHRLDLHDLLPCVRLECLEISAPHSERQNIACLHLLRDLRSFSLRCKQSDLASLAGTITPQPPTPQPAIPQPPPQLQHVTWFPEIPCSERELAMLLTWRFLTTLCVRMSLVTVTALHTPLPPHVSVAAPSKAHAESFRQHGINTRIVDLLDPSFHNPCFCHH